MFNGELKDYRQPMVTSIGIMMGFLLNFLASWAIDDADSIETVADWTVVLTLLTALLMMIYVLARLLTNRIGQRAVDEYYYLTFKLYISSIMLAFIGVFSALFV